jgi:hypothetical protein
MAETETDVERIRRRVADLEGRVHTLESIAIRSLAFVTAALLVFGSVLPILIDGRDFDPVNLRLATAPFEIFGSLGEYEDDEGFGVVIGLGFLGLMACVVIALGICIAQWRRWAGPRTARTAMVVAVLLLIGMFGPILFTFGATNPDLDDAPGPAMWYFVPGVVIFAATAFNEHLRQLWSQEE